MKPIKVLIADDHFLVRYGIKSALDNASGIEIVGEAGSGRETLALYEKHKPDVSVVDITMPKMDGIRTTREIIKKYPKAKILILSMHVNEDYLSKVIRAGALGYLYKNCDKQELIKAVRKVANGEKVFSDQISSLITDRFISQTRQVDESSGYYHNNNLTPREKEILKLISKGHTSQKIAEILIISPRTVETHRTNLMRKLEINNTAGLVRYAIENGYTDD